MHKFILIACLATTCVAGMTPVALAQAKTPLAFVTNNPSDYWTLCQKGTAAAAKHLGNVSVQFVMPDDGTAAKQKADINDLLAKGVKGIAVAPVDPANETPYLNTVAAKTKLITADSDAPNSQRQCYIGTDNHAAGEMAGRLLRNALPQGGQVMVFVGKSDAQNASERIAGLREALRGSRVQVLGVRTDDADHARAIANVRDTLTRYPHLAGMVGIWSYNGPAILNGLQNAGKLGKVKVVAFDEEDATISGVQNGTVYAAVTQDPYQFGYQSVLLLAELTHGNRHSIPKSKQRFMPTHAVTRANVAAYLAEQKRHLSGN